MLQGLESDQAHLAGLEFRLKSQESLVRKLISNAEDMEVSIRETVPAIWDVIRYTMVVDDEMYTPVVKSIISALEEKGCQERSREGLDHSSRVRRDHRRDL